MDNVFPEYDDKKSKILILSELLLQVMLNCVIFYIMREYTHALVMMFASLRTHVYGTPAKFAELIVSPTMFLAQQNLMKKISYVWGVKIDII
jgi:hypothetical protein